jgi:hypothetical protein
VSQKLHHHTGISTVISGKSKHKKFNRKEARKNEREEKKQRKATHFQNAHKSYNAPPSKRTAEEEVPEQRLAKKAKVEPKPKQTTKPPPPTTKRKKTVDLDINPTLLLISSEFPEDAEIARLEKLLGKSKGKPKDKAKDPFAGEFDFGVSHVSENFCW